MLSANKQHTILVKSQHDFDIIPTYSAVHMKFWHFFRGLASAFVTLGLYDLPTRRHRTGHCKVGKCCHVTNGGKTNGEHLVTHRKLEKKINVTHLKLNGFPVERCSEMKTGNFKVFKFSMFKFRWLIDSLPLDIKNPELLGFLLQCRCWAENCGTPLTVWPAQYPLHQLKDFLSLPAQLGGWESPTETCFR